VSDLQGPAAWWSLFGFTIFMVSREGIETATMIASLAANADATDMTVGAVIGVLLAGAVSLMWVKFGHKVNLGRFFRVTSWFMMVFAIQLVVYALHEFTEAGVVPGGCKIEPDGAIVVLIQTQESPRPENRNPWDDELKL
jgi:high-affinity iron transporter